MFGKDHNESFFSPILNSVHFYLLAVVEANPDRLIELMRDDSSLIFAKGKITDLARHTFYDVSPYQLMIFLSDYDMCQRTIQFILNESDPEMILKLKEQLLEIDIGGADLVRVNRNPEELSFDDLVQHDVEYQVSGDLYKETFMLLENPDGIVYYQDEDGRHLYYVNKEDKEVIKLEVSPEQHLALRDLYSSLDSLEDNSSRRSSNVEYNLIVDILKVSLRRKGIDYTYKGVDYCDTRFNFNVIYNSYKKAIRLYGKSRVDDANTAWIELGMRQKELLWLLQFFCQSGMSFSPNPNISDSHYIQNNRNFKLRNGKDIRREYDKIGNQYAIYRPLPEGRVVFAADSRYGSQPIVVRDFIFVHRLISNERAMLAASLLELPDEHLVELEKSHPCF